MGSHGVGHEWSDLAEGAITCIKRTIDGNNAVVSFYPLPCVIQYKWNATSI